MQKHPTKDLWILNYSKTCTYAGEWDEVTLAARGLVVDKDAKIVARPFIKFFNKEELEQREVLINNPLIDKIPSDLPFEAFEKMDGSLGILFYYDDEWIFASRGSFRSAQAFEGTEMFKECCLTDPYVPENLFKDHTYVFEIIYPANRIVVNYGSDEKLVLLGAIRTEDGEEMSYEELSLRYYKSFALPKVYDINDFNKLRENPLNNHEGFVVRFSNGVRVKVKFEEYCRLHSIVTNVSNKTIWEHLKDGSSFEELLDRVPDEIFSNIEKVIKELEYNFNMVELECLREYVKIVHEIDGLDMNFMDRTFEYKKLFALRALKFKYSGILFNIYDGKDYSQTIWKIVKPAYAKPFAEDDEG